MDVSHSQPSQDPLCAFCGGDVPFMDAIIYHGVVYHPMCVAPTTKRTPPAGETPNADLRPKCDD